MPYRLAKMQMKGEMLDERLWSHPFLLVGILAHAAFAVLFFLILLFLALWLWEKVKAERHRNSQLRKRKS